MKALKLIWNHSQGRTALLSFIFLLLATVFYFLPTANEVIWRGLALLSVVIGGYEATIEAIESIRKRQIDVHILMVLAAIGAIAIGDYLEAAGLLFLFCLSEALENFAMGRTKSAIESLMKLRPNEANVLVDGEIVSRPLASLVPGDIVVVRPFNAIPSDGVVVTGKSSLDASAMTGESRPVYVEPGMNILAGTQNLEGLLEVKVTAKVGEATLDRIVALVSEAQQNKASGERVASWFGEKYTFLVVGAFLVSVAVRLLIHQSPRQALYDSLTLLVGMSPCALVISTPATTLSALAWSARNGMLIRGGEFIEKAANIDRIALDKTGTITLGKPRLQEVCLCHEPVLVGSAMPEKHEGCWVGSGPMSPEAAEFLSAAAAVEQHSDHPLAKAIFDHAKAENLSIPTVTGVEVIPGMGMIGSVNGKQVAIGTERLLDSLGMKWPSHMKTRIKEMQDDGLTASYVTLGDEVAAFGFGDQIREEAKDLVQELKSLGVKDVTMLSGDNHPTVMAVSNKVGLDSFHADLLPEEKAKLIREMSLGSTTMMVGDGVNDAPSLAGATIGVAMGGLGSDVALEAADVVLMTDRLSLIPLLIRLGRKTNRIIKGNLFFAAGVVTALTIGSIFTQMPLMLAVVCHEGSTVVVILSGLRLLRGPRKESHSS